MEEESTLRGGTEGGSKPPPSAPAFFVILHPSQGDGSKEEGILVANRDVSSVAPVITTGPNESKSDFFLSSNCTSGEITVTLDSNNMWNEFSRCNTEMVLTKQGRRMFPYCRYWISGLNPCLKYILLMDITPLDNHKYKWNGKRWEIAGKADPHVLGRVFLHPESPSTGQYWMHQPVSFYKLKLTNNILDQDGHIILHSMHRYLPRLHVIPAEKASEVIQLNGPDVHTFTFPQTEFIAVTAYQNFQITQLKIDCNPFAKGFREGTVMGRPGKDIKHKPAEQEVDSLSCKTEVEDEEPSAMTKLQELFKMSEYLDGDKENETFSSVQDFLRFAKSASEQEKNAKPNEDVMKRLNEPSSAVSLSKPMEQPTVKIKKEPEDDYDYSQTIPVEGITVKQEQLHDDCSNSDVDYPILEKQFAKFKEDPYLDGNLSANSPTGVAKAKLLKLEQDSMYLEPCAAAKNNLEAPDLQMSGLSEDTLQDMDVHKSTIKTESPSVIPISSVTSHVGDVCAKEKRKRICKKKIDEIYATLQTALRTSRGPKRKFPSLFPKSSVTPTPGNESTVAPVPKKRGRPPKPKMSKVGRPPKKDNLIGAPRLFPEFNPDLEDVDGVLFVAFSSKEALDVHTGKKPTDPVASSILPPEASIELTDEMQKILGLEKHLLIHLKTMKYRQVIHPALQQVGLKLNIVDPAMSIDLRYLGVDLQQLYITSDTKYVDNGLCAQGLPFVSRTGKTTDYTKIKGWRDKFSTDSATSSQKNEAGRSESSVKNLSAFCSDELDEYLEKEAKFMDDLKELTQNEPESSISYQLPTKSSSYVRTLDSVLKKQAQQAMSSVNATEQFPVPRQKRKYTRRVSTPRSNSKARLILPSATTKPHFPEKGYSVSQFRKKGMSTSSHSVEYLSKSHPMVKTEDEQSDIVQPNLVTSVEDVVYQNCQQVQSQGQQSVSKPLGFSKVQMKLMELEETAVWEGKPRTYITEERAEIALSTLLTAQVSLKNKPIQKFINKRTTLCNNEFCRLGCICSSLNFAKHTATHCGHETCMFSCTCLKKLYTEKDGSKASRTTQDEAESDFSFIPGCGYQLVEAEHKVESLEVKRMEEQQEMSVDGLHDRPMKAKKKSEGNVRTPMRFPIWNRSDIAEDPEPLCIPERAEFVEPRNLQKGHTDKSKSTRGGKPGRPSTVVRPEDPVYLYFDSMMTCARVRPYECKAPEEKKKKAQSICGSDILVKQPDLKLRKGREREKKDDGDDEIVEKKCKAVDNSRPTKLIKIISDSSCKEEDNKVLNITSQQMTSSEPQSFKLGSFNIELMKEKKIGEKFTSGTLCSRVKIAMSPEKQLNPAPPRPEKCKVESSNPPEEEPEDTSDKEAKSLGGKGLPFYTKVIPAGKLVTRLKTSNLREAELVEVNGKKYPQAKLLLGQMGALHPANRLAAYITRRLQPSLFHLSKVNEASAKMAAKNLSSDLTTGENSKGILISQQNKTAAQPRPSSMFTQFVMGEVGSMQKSPGVSSPEPTILGSPKLSIQSTRLLFVSPSVAAGKQAPAITTTTSSFMNLASLSTTTLSSAGLSAASPSKKKTPSLPTLMHITKLVTKDSSVSIPTGIVAANDAHSMTLTSVPSNKDTVLRPPVLSPALVKSVATTGNTSSVSSSQNPDINQSIATSIPNLLVAPNIRLGSVASQVGLNIASPMTVKTVTTSPVSALSPPGVTSGPEKRLGPRLLIIPVNSTSAPARPVQCVQSSPGQKMVLQPIKNANGVTLFRHPNGQIIQLVPLQQVPSANNQPNRPQVVIRNPGPVLGIRLPLPAKPKAAATTSISIPATTVPPTSAPATSPVVSPSKTNSNKPGVIIVPQTPPKLSQFGMLAMKATPPTSNCEAALAIPQAVIYSDSEQVVLPSNVTPLESEGLSLANVPPPVLQNGSPINAAANIMQMDNKLGTVSDLKKQDKKLSDSPSGSSGEKTEKEDVKESKEQPTLENVNYEAGVQGSTKEQIKSGAQQVISLTKDEQYQNGQQDNEPSQLSVESINQFLASDVDVLQEARNKDAQGGLTGEEQGTADKGENQQSPTDKNTNSQGEIGDSSPVSLVSASVQEKVAAGVEQNILYKTEETAELSIDQRSSKPQVSALSSNPLDNKSFQVDPHSKEAVFDEETQHSLQSEDESEDDESVDIESVEELYEKINLACQKESTTNFTLNKDRCGTQGIFSKRCKGGFKIEDDESVDIETMEELSEKIHLASLKTSDTHVSLNEDKCCQGKHPKCRRKHSKVNGQDIFLTIDEVPLVCHRKNHTANERKRRSELRDLFEELKNALGLHNLPKVSKSYILKQAIEEVEDLTDTADTLIKKKILLSQTQTQLVKKVSNLSGKPRDIVMKKLEYLYEKQKAMDLGEKQENLEEEEEEDVHKTSINSSPSVREPFPPLMLMEETNETLNSKTKKPIILARKPMLLSNEGKPQQPGVSLITSNAPTGQVVNQEHEIVEQVAALSPTLIQAELSPAQMKSGMTSVLIQLPSTIQLKGIFGNSPLPISLSTVPGNISTTTLSDPVSESDDLSMMPKIVNVTSLAQGTKSDFDRELEIALTETEKEFKSDSLSLRTESYVSGNASVQDAGYVTAKSCEPSTSISLDKMEESLKTDPERKSCSPYSSILEHLAQENNNSNTEAPIKSEHVSISNASPNKMIDDIKASRLDLELKKLTSAIDEAGLEPSELSDTMADPEDADETLTSLLNEIAFLNQQLNTDTDFLDSVSDFPEPDSASHSSVSKFADGNSSPFSFGRFKEMPEAKEKNISFSPLFMQLEEGEILDSSKHNEEAGIMVFEGGAIEEPHLTDVMGPQSGLHQPPSTVSTQRTEKPVTPCSDIFWRPMPKLAPLGLKSHTIPSDQSVLTSKPMPSLASVATRTSMPKTNTD